MKTSIKKSILFIYGIAAIGDLTFSLVVTSSILYAVQLGGNPTETGLIGGGYGIAYLISPSIFGKASDKISRRTSLVIATSLQFLIAIFLLMFANTIGLLFLCQIFFGFIYGFFWPSIQAFISENTDNSEEEHQKGLSNFCISWSIGFMLGPLLGGIFSDFNFKIAFLFTALLYIISFLLVIIGIPNINKMKSSKLNIQDNVESSPFKENEEGINLLGDLNRDCFEKPAKTIRKEKNNLIIIIFTMFIYAMMSRLILSYFTDYAVRPESLNWSGTLTGQVIFIFGIGRTIYFLTARVTKLKFFRSSFYKVKSAFLLYGIMLALIVIIKNLWLMIILFILIGFVGGLIYLSSLDLLILNEKKSKGAKAGLFESSIGLGSILSPILAGVLGNFVSYLPFIVFSILTIIIWLIIRKK